MPCGEIAIKDAELADSGFVSRETWERLETYADPGPQMATKNQSDLAKDAAGSVDRHILDSLQLFPEAGSPRSTWIDMGSGAGFPGLVTAICLIERDQGWVIWWKATTRKLHFCVR
jgi:16S rRNA (guanine527-N7)-methyltransferase